MTKQARSSVSRRRSPVGLLGPSDPILPHSPSQVAESLQSASEYSSAGAESAVSAARAHTEPQAAHKERRQPTATLSAGVAAHCRQTDPIRIVYYEPRGQNAPRRAGGVSGDLRSAGRRGR